MYKGYRLVLLNYFSEGNSDFSCSLNEFTLFQASPLPLLHFVTATLAAPLELEFMEPVDFGDPLISKWVKDCSEELYDAVYAFGESQL